MGHRLSIVISASSDRKRAPDRESTWADRAH
jgi:hypothetical protein